MGGAAAVLLGWAIGVPSAYGQQEPPYFVTYSAVLEEPGNLEIESQNIVASPGGARTFYAPTIEFEYGATAWWTAEMYVQGQATQGDSGIFTGFRVENRFRPLPREYAVNPVIYVEYEDVNAGDRSYLEVTGNSDADERRLPNATLQRDVDREIEGKLILSSNVRGWNISENLIAEKELNHPEPWEFGYAVAAARRLGSGASSRPCIVCRQNIAAGAELFGGLGTRYTFGLRETEQYLGPTAALMMPSGATLKFSPEFGLTDDSVGVLWRFGVSYEIPQVRDWFRRSK